MFYCSVCLLDATAAMRLSEIGEDTTRLDPIFTKKTFPPQLNCLFCQHSPDVIRLTDFIPHSCCSGQCGHAASSWVKKSGGGEEVFMIKSIVG